MIRMKIFVQNFCPPISFPDPRQYFRRKKEEIIDASFGRIKNRIMIVKRVK